MKHFLQFIVVALFVSNFLIAQNIPTENMRSPKDHSLRSHIPKKPWERSRNLRTPIQHSLSKISSGVDTGWVRHTSSRTSNLPSESWTTAIQVDGNKNVYVTGYSHTTLTGFDFATVKYNSAGVQQWVSRYTSNGNQDDEAYALAIDACGNVYVTGISADDFATVKYDPSGKELWVARYGGSDIDIPSDMKIDDSGNVYVTGTSNITLDSIYEVGGNYTTIKYNSSGTQQWIAHYGAAGSSEDRVSALAVDGSGNVFVTGYINRIVYKQVTFSPSDFGTIKYNTNGVQQWVAIYNGVANNDDEAVALSVDKSGNVFVTGNSLDSVGLSDYATIKYNALGEEQWVAKYNSPTNRDDRVVALGIHPSGDVYVTGSHYYYGFMFETIKYDSTGQQKWIAKYYDLGFSNSIPSALVVDQSGNVIVSGATEMFDPYDFLYIHYSTVKYNSNGEQQWAAQLDSTDATSSAVAIDSSGNVYITGSSECFRSRHFGLGPLEGGNYGTIKYDSNGVQQWITRYNGFGKLIVTGAAQNIAVDYLGNIYVAGGDSIEYIMKYNSKGEVLWTIKQGGGNIVVDSAGNVYVMGNKSVAMYSTTGVQQWAAYLPYYDQSPNFTPHAMAIDEQGNVYVTGEYYYQTITIKYNSAGIQQWAIGYHETNGDFCYDIVVDRLGNVYITGTIGRPYYGADFLTIKYNSLGILQWVSTYARPGYNYNTASKIGLDTSGNVYVSGGSYNSGTNSSDVTTIKYNSAGVQQWVTKYRFDKIDPSGNTYSFSMLRDSVLDKNYFSTTKTNSSGVQQWVSKYYRENNADNFADLITLDQAGNVYVTGTTAVDINNISNNDFTTIKYNSSGIEQWVAQYNGPENSNDIPNDLTVDLSGNVYVAGTSNVIGGSISTIVKYVQTPTSVAQNNSLLPNNFTLEQNYPNPFNPTTVISYQLPVISKVTLKVYDVLGREVATLVNEEQSAGWREVQWNAKDVSSGIYFYKLTAASFVDVKKMLVVK